MFQIKIDQEGNKEKMQSVTLNWNSIKNDWNRQFEGNSNMDQALDNFVELQVTLLDLAIELWL